MNHPALLKAHLESAFGSRIMVRGFLLNNELTDFDFAPGGPNQVGPGKRPRSSMAPAMLFSRDGQLQLVVGSTGFVVAPIITIAPDSAVIVSVG